MVPGPLNAMGYAVVASLAATVGLLFAAGGAFAGYAPASALLAVLFLLRARRLYRRRESEGGGEPADGDDDERRDRKEKEMYGKSYGWL